MSDNDKIVRVAAAEVAVDVAARVAADVWKKEKTDPFGIATTMDIGYFAHVDLSKALDALVRAVECLDVELAS